MYFYCFSRQIQSSNNLISTDKLKNNYFSQDINILSTFNSIELLIKFQKRNLQAEYDLTEKNSGYI